MRRENSDGTTFKNWQVLLRGTIICPQSYPCERMGLDWCVGAGGAVRLTMIYYENLSIVQNMWFG